jgi:hypothetical protein
MINLQTFESYGSDSRKDLYYDDAIFWFDKLEPEEMCFLLLWSTTKNQIIKTKTEENVSDPEESGSGSGEQEISYKVSNGEAVLFIDFSFSGGFTKYYRATYDSPAEGGDFFVDYISIDSCTLYLDTEEKSLDFDFLSKIQTLKYGKEILRLCEKTAEYATGADSKLKIEPVVFPEELKEKIEKVRSELPGDLKRGFSVIKKLGL